MFKHLHDFFTNSLTLGHTYSFEKYVIAFSWYPQFYVTDRQGLFFLSKGPLTAYCYTLANSSNVWSTSHKLTDLNFKEDLDIGSVVKSNLFSYRDRFNQQIFFFKSILKSLPVTRRNRVSSYYHFVGSASLSERKTNLLLLVGATKNGYWCYTCGFVGFMPSHHWKKAKKIYLMRGMQLAKIYWKVNNYNIFTYVCMMLKTATFCNPKLTFARLTIKYRFWLRTREKSDKDTLLDSKTFVDDNRIHLMFFNYPEDL